MNLTFAALLTLSAHATRLQVETVRCPVGGAPTKVYERTVSNTLGGFDSDLAAYSDSGQFRQYAVSTCPDNLVSMYGPDMRETLTAVQQTAVLEATSRLRPALPAPDDLEVWDRYLLAAAAYRALERPKLDIAEVYLTASWTARDRAVGVVRGLEGPIITRKLLIDGASELEKGLTIEQRQNVLFNMARVAHRGGYVTERDQYISELKLISTDDQRMQEAIAKLQHYGAVIEPELQDRAIAAYTEALREKLPMADKIRATYLLADLLRRRNRATEALPLFTRVMSEETAPLNLREMSAALHKELVATSANQP